MPRSLSVSLSLGKIKASEKYFHNRLTDLSDSFFSTVVHKYLCGDSLRVLGGYHPLPCFFCRRHSIIWHMCRTMQAEVGQERATSSLDRLSMIRQSIPQMMCSAERTTTLREMLVEVVIYPRIITIINIFRAVSALSRRPFAFMGRSALTSLKNLDACASQLHNTHEWAAEEMIRGRDHRLSHECVYTTTTTMTTELPQS